MKKSLMFVAALLGAASASAVPAVWEGNFGSAIVAGDDNTTNGTFAFAFPFLSSSYSSYEASTNGFVSLGGQNGQGCCSGNVSQLLNGAPRIAPQWFDWVDTVYLNTAVAGRAVFTWQGFEYYNPSVTFTTQAQLFADGRITLGFDGPSIPMGHTSLTGISTGGGAADPGGSVLAGSKFSTSNGQGFYQLFNSGTFDLNQSNLFITPNRAGGVDVSAKEGPSISAVPEPETWMLLIAGFGMIGARARHRRNTMLPIAL